MPKLISECSKLKFSINKLVSKFLHLFMTPNSVTWNLMLNISLQAGPRRHADDHIIIELQQRIRVLQEKLDSVGSYEVRCDSI